MVWPDKYLLVNTTIRTEKALCARIFVALFPEHASKTRTIPAACCDIPAGGDNEYSG
jgi:hypothetical protein